MKYKNLIDRIVDDSPNANDRTKANYQNALARTLEVALTMLSEDAIIALYKQRFPKMPGDLPIIRRARTEANSRKR